MTQEEKELLLKDLCDRAIYSPTVHIEGNWFDNDREAYDAVLTLEKLLDFKTHDYILKPYLRPMSSITEEERDIFPTPYCFDDFSFEYDGIVSVIPSDVNSILLTFDEIFPIIDWLNSHHFDYSNLIEKGLALEAPEDMYKEN